MKRYIDEADGHAVNQLLDTTIAAMSRLSTVEVGSAFARRTREGRIDAATRDTHLARFADDATTFEIIEIDEDVAQQASSLLVRHPLRAADAIQLASALLLRSRIGDMSSVFFLTFDRALDRAARAEGLSPPPMLTASE